MALTGGFCPHNRTRGGNQGDLKGPTTPLPPIPVSPPPSLTGLLILPTHQVCPASWEHMEHSRTLWNTLLGRYSLFRVPHLRSLIRPMQATLPQVPVFIAPVTTWPNLSLAPGGAWDTLRGKTTHVPPAEWPSV